jgi:hypothetical protein
VFIINAWKIKPVLPLNNGLFVELSFNRFYKNVLVNVGLKTFSTINYDSSNRLVYMGNGLEQFTSKISKEMLWKCFEVKSCLIRGTDFPFRL